MYNWISKLLSRKKIIKSLITKKIINNRLDWLVEYCIFSMSRGMNKYNMKEILMYAPYSSLWSDDTNIPWKFKSMVFIIDTKKPASFKYEQEFKEFALNISKISIEHRKSFIFITPIMYEIVFFYDYQYDKFFYETNRDNNAINKK